MAFTLLCRSGTSMMLRIFPIWIVWAMTALSKRHSRSDIPYARWATFPRFTRLLTAALMWILTHYGGAGNPDNEKSVADWNISYAWKRKVRDSNPRYGQAVQRISSPPHSITLATFLWFAFRFLECGAKVGLYFDTTKVYCIFFKKTAECPLKKVMHPADIEVV